MFYDKGLILLIISLIDIIMSAVYFFFILKLIEVENENLNLFYK